MPLNSDLYNAGRSVNAIWNCRRLTPNEKLILFFLSSRSQNTDELLAESQANIARCTCLSVSSVRRLMKELLEKGFVVIKCRQPGTKIYIYEIVEEQLRESQ